MSISLVLPFDPRPSWPQRVAALPTREEISVRLLSRMFCGQDGRGPNDL
jgi:hypothetical protein